MKKIFLISLYLFFVITALAQDHFDFNLKLLSGNEVSFKEISSEKIVLINFWALWCKPCRTEMKSLNKLYEKYMQKDLLIIGINIDTPRSNSKVESFIRTLGIDYPIALDPNSELFNKFNGQLLPLNILYDIGGKVVFRHTGYLPGDEIKLEEEILKLIGDAK